MRFTHALRRPVAWLSFGAVLAIATPAHAERVPLKTGETVLGRLVRDRCNVNVVVIEDYVSGGLREFVWDAVTDEDARTLKIGLGIQEEANAMLKGELIVYRLNSGTGDVRGVVEKVEGGFLYVRNVSQKEPYRIALTDVASREPLDLDQQEVWSLDEVVARRKAEKEPQDAQGWLLVAQFCERVGAFEQAKEGYDTAATDEAFLQRELARTSSVRMAALIADKGSFDELRELRVKMGANLWKPVKEGLDTFLTRQVSAVSSLGYTYRRELLPTFRTNVIGAFKRYVDAKATQWSFAANAFYSLGISTEVGLQYQFRNRSFIPEAFGDNFAHSIKIAFIVAVDTTSGPKFDARDSPLNTESGYLP